MKVFNNKKVLIAILLIGVIITVAIIKLGIAEDVFTKSKNPSEIPNIDMGGEVYDPNKSINKDPLFEIEKGVEVDLSFIEEDIPPEELNEEIIDKRKEEIESRDNEVKEIYEIQKDLLESGELRIGEETNIEEGIIAEEDLIEWGNKVIPSANISTKQAIEDIKVALGKDTYDYKALESDFEGEKLEEFNKDYEQLITNPYSSTTLTEIFEIYRKSGQLDYFVSSVGAWLMNGGDDGVSHTKLE